MSQNSDTKMGLLSDPESGSGKWVKLLLKIHRPVCLLCCIGAVVWFVLLGNKAFNNSTYFSENALLPGLVKNDFNDERAANQLYTDFLEEISDKYDNNDDMPVPWLVAKMAQIHLEVYTHNFTLNYPLARGQVYEGTNVYGILRAPRTSSLEALVVSVPYRPPSSHQKGTAAGIALMLAFAKFARPQKYWAKDIIFLVTEHEQLGMQAWLEAYHGIESKTETFYSSLGSFWKQKDPSMDLWGKSWSGDGKKCLNPGKLKGRSGAIQAAINLEFHTPKIKYVEVKVEGLNGQLPNLDLVNLVNKMCIKSGVHHSFKSSYSWIKNRRENAEWINNLWTLVGMVSTQVPGVPNGNHGLFHRFGIEAVTLEGREPIDPAGVAPKASTLSTCNFHRLGTALEGTLRSLNNLLERFHQSYFFYLLAATDRFISIGQYMPSLCLLCGALLIRALALWVSTQQNDEELDEKEKKEAKNDDDKADDVKSKDGDGKTEDDDKKSQDDIAKVTDDPQEKCDDETVLQSTPGKKKKSKKPKEKSIDDSNLSIVNVGTNYFMMHVMGYVIMNSPIMFTKIASTYHQTLPTEVTIYYGLVVTSVLLTLAPFLPRALRSTPMSYEEMSLVNVLVLIELSTVCLAVGMHNFSLGLCVAMLYAPLALIVGVVRKNSSRIGHVVLRFKQLLCLLLHPMSAVTLGLMLTSMHLFPEESTLHVLGRGRDAAMQAITFAVVDSLIYGNWLFNVAAAVLLPIWLIFWEILCNKVN